jgi:hypothetical protein
MYLITVKVKILRKFVLQVKLFKLKVFCFQSCLGKLVLQKKKTKKNGWTIGKCNMMISLGIVYCGKFSSHMVNNLNLPNFRRPKLHLLLKKHGKGNGAKLLRLKGRTLCLWHYKCLIKWSSGEKVWTLCIGLLLKPDGCKRDVQKNKAGGDVEGDSILLDLILLKSHHSTCSAMCIGSTENISFQKSVRHITQSICTYWVMIRQWIRFVYLHTR